MNKQFDLNIHGYPYIITFKNISNQEQDCVLFGMDKLQKKADNNYGHPDCISIVNENNDNPYGYSMVMIQSQLNPYRAGLIELKSKELKNVKQKIVYSNERADGGIEEQNLCEIMFRIELEADNTYSTTLKTEWNISGNASILFKLQPNSELSFVLYPLKKETKTNLSEPIAESKDKTPFNITITNPTDKPTTSVIFGFDNTNPQDKRPSLIERIEWKSETKGQLEQKVFVCDSEDNKNKFILHLC